MATKKITFDPEAGAAYAANFSMLGLSLIHISEPTRPY